MRFHVIVLLVAVLSLSACQPKAETKLATPSAEAQLTPTLLQLTSTPAGTQAMPPTPEPETALPPAGQYLDYLEGLSSEIFALTIDDGYGQIPFDQIIMTLRQREVHATFFLVAEASHILGIERMQTLADDGHTIAYHSLTHAALEIVEEWGQSDWIADYEAWEESMRLLLGDELHLQLVRPYARAPYGLFNRPFLGMTEEKDLIPLGWSRDPGDLNVGLKVRPGDIFLLHVRYPDAEIMANLLDAIELTPVSLDELFAAWQPDPQ
jgi:peptidoglycan/xylan/chitin deacetylase (PgdA/CDA1 family)